MLSSTFLQENGYIIHVLGSSKATENDASIMRTITEKMPEVHYRFHESDVFVVDRGFRVIREYLERKGFVVKMPDIIPSNESHLSDMLSNGA